jgi:hypothetical protein
MPLIPRSHRTLFLCPPSHLPRPALGWAGWFGFPWSFWLLVSRKQLPSPPTPRAYLRPRSFPPCTLRTSSSTYRAEGHDLPSLLFSFLDELLFEFNTELFLAAEVRITRFDREAFVIDAEG